MYMWVCASEYRCPKRTETDFVEPESEVVGAGNTAETLWESSMLSHPLSHLSRPHPSIHLKNSS